MRVPTRLQAALVLLHEAMQYANETGCDCWDFAVEIEQLNLLDLSPNDFRWLVRKGYVEHQREITLEGENGREFQPTGDLTFSSESCFVLTKEGISVASKVCKAANSRTALDLSDTFPAGNGEATSNHKVLSDPSSRQDESSRPIWDWEKRELRMNGSVVKRFKWRAPNQEAVLAAFQEEDWPTRIDDPLSPQPQLNCKRRLCDTIKCLNRKQISELIHFRGDGSGEGIIWEMLSQNGSNGRK